ncbi:MAG: protein kinase domain-containing protein [Cyanobacteriota bacterium]
MGIGYVPRQSLKALLEAGHHFTEAEVKQIATDVLSVLIYLHQLSPPLLHRDIKPSNLIADAQGRTHVVDFSSVQDHTPTPGQSFTVVGSYLFIPSAAAAFTCSWDPVYWENGLPPAPAALLRINLWINLWINRLWISSFSLPAIDNPVDPKALRLPDTPGFCSRSRADGAATRGAVLGRSVSGGALVSVRGGDFIGGILAVCSGFVGSSGVGSPGGFWA